jgi:signal transduction histidine kinase
MDKPVILIVDDEHSNQFLLEGLLNAHDYNTLTASSGEECLEILKTQLPDLILLDIMMPKMTGIEVLERIMKSEELKHIPVLMVSAKTSTDDVEESLGKGAIDYIKKPFDETELLARVRVGIRLKENENHLKDMVQQREEIVRIISHDLRSPFAAINGFAGILLNDENLTGEQKQSLSFIIDSVQFSQDYFNKLLSWTKLEHNNIQLNKTRISVSKIINISGRILKKKATDKGIRLINDIDEHIILNVDDTYFQQVINNLLNNAIKFTKNNGTIRCYYSINNAGIEVVVSDSGIGMPENVTPDMLFKTDIVKSRRGTGGEKGTGLGLGICKKILDAHGFDITFRKNEQGGTDFIILIPKNLV